MQVMNEKRYLVVNNNELQYSIWPADCSLPIGWHAAGFEGARAECLAHISEIWTDMRPLSVRHHMETNR